MIFRSELRHACRFSTNAHRPHALALTVGWRERWALWFGVAAIAMRHLLSSESHWSVGLGFSEVFKKFHATFGPGFHGSRAR